VLRETRRCLLPLLLEMAHLLWRHTLQHLLRAQLACGRERAGCVRAAGLGLGLADGHHQPRLLVRAQVRAKADCPRGLWDCNSATWQPLPGNACPASPGSCGRPPDAPLAWTTVCCLSPMPRVTRVVCVPLAPSSTVERVSTTCSGSRRGLMSAARAGRHGWLASPPAQPHRGLRSGAPVTAGGPPRQAQRAWCCWRRTRRPPAPRRPS
jgi:hypothetical protein